MQVEMCLPRRCLWHFAWNVHHSIKYSYLLNESSAPCNCNSLENQLLGCARASGTDEYISSENKRCSFFLEIDDIYL